MARKTRLRAAGPSVERGHRHPSIGTKSTYIFGAIYPEPGKGAGLVRPFCNTQTMSLHLAEISLAIAPGAHAVALLDQAGGHMTGKLEVPGNISIIPLPTNRPELN